jgi:hypothetical protein
MSLTQSQVRHVKEICNDHVMSCPVKGDLDSLKSEMNSLGDEIRSFKDVMIQFKTKVELIGQILMKLFITMGGLAGVGTFLGIVLKVSGKL